MYEDHPVLNSLQQRLSALREQYSRVPNELNRYRVVRQEQLIAQWAPSAPALG